MNGDHQANNPQDTNPASGGTYPTDRPPTSGPQRPDQPRRHQILSEQDVLQAISALPGAIATGLLATNKVNAMMSAYRELLRHRHDQDARGGQATISEDLLQELARNNPAVLQQLAPFLTIEQVRLLTQGGDDAS